MKRLVVKVYNKDNVLKLNEFCKVVYVSRFLNVVGVEIDEKNIRYIEENENVISFRECEQGNFQPSVAIN